MPPSVFVSLTGRDDATHSSSTRAQHVDQVVRIAHPSCGDALERLLQGHLQGGPLVGVEVIAPSSSTTRSSVGAFGQLHRLIDDERAVELVLGHDTGLLDIDARHGPLTRTLLDAFVTMLVGIP